jgi:hypothetical protein
MNAPTFELCTSPAAKKRHLSTDLREGGFGGRTGRTLCGQHAGDQARVDAAARHFGAGPLVTVAELSPCKACARAAAAIVRRSS